mmetsp:Transcript_86128/g.278247  ORF Transcript_86128/g.278247 Transcript_86128/m.278247 type:complete len:122 (-) Transcript_86128:73-438(-)
MMGMDVQMSQADAILFEARFQTESLKRIQSLCWDRCADGLLAESTEDTGDKLPDATRKCLDRCVSKFTDTAIMVSVHSQNVQAALMQEQQMQQLASRAALGAVVSAAAVGLGCFLFRGGDD